jgi:hypothetical protein
MACLVWVWRHEGRRPAATLAGALVAPVVIGYALFGGTAAVAPVLASGARQSRVSVWRMLLPSGAALSPTVLVRHVALIAAVAVVGLGAVLVLARLGEGSAAPVLVASLAGYLLLAGYVLPWYFAWVLPIAALDGQSLLSRLLGAQTVCVLIAYQYHANGNGDGLDGVLHSGAAGAQLIAMAGTLALVCAALVALRRRSLRGADA